MQEATFIQLPKTLSKKHGVMLTGTEETRKEHSEDFGSQESMPLQEWKECHTLNSCML